MQRCDAMMHDAGMRRSSGPAEVRTPLRPLEAQRVALNHGHLRLAVGVVEGPPPAQQHVRDHAERPHVHRRVVRLLAVARHELGRHVAQRAEALEHDLVPRRHLAREAKVDEPAARDAKRHLLVSRQQAREQESAGWAPARGT